MPACVATLFYSLLCVECRQRGLVHVHVVDVVALASQDVQSVRKLLSLKQCLFVLPMLDLFFHHIFFHSLRLLDVFFFFSD